jgi:hypothetical protein
MSLQPADTLPAGSRTASGLHRTLPTETASVPLEVVELAAPSPAPLELAEFDTEGRPPPFPHLLRHPLRAMAWVIRTAFGLASLILLLAVLAAIPIVNFLALGYLLEVEARLARTGKLRNAFPLLGLAPRIGAIALGTWLWVWPLRLLSGAAADARLIDPGSAADRNLHVLTFLAWALITAHLCLALARGGTLGCFFRPIKNVRWLRARLRSGDYFATAGGHVRDFVSRLRLRHHFWLGLRGFLGAFLWLLVPTLMYAAARKSEGGPVLITMLGGALLVLVFAWAPFLQAHFAAQNRWGAYRDLGTVRDLFRHAPIAWLLAVIVVYVLALPLYLFQIVTPPADAMWGITLVFIASIYPARVVTGWAYHRAARKRREGRRSWFVTRLGVRLLMLPLIASYVFLLFFTQFIGEEGKLTLFHHHAFLLPWPFFVAFD